MVTSAVSNYQHMNNERLGPHDEDVMTEAHIVKKHKANV